MILHPSNSEHPTWSLCKNSGEDFSNVIRIGNYFSGFLALEKYLCFPKPLARRDWVKLASPRCWSGMYPSACAFPTEPSGTFFERLFTSYLSWDQYGFCHLLRIFFPPWSMKAPFRNGILYFLGLSRWYQHWFDELEPLCMTNMQRT